MCGIVGWASTTPCVDRAIVARMTNVLAHRGPDGQGVYVSADSRVGIGHRRLAIIDLSPAASQPMQDRTRRATVVFNGEIYNHAALRRELERAGRVFQTDHSDTETLLQSYLHWGFPHMLSRLNGMFAFAIVDETEGAVFLARDRVGIKPLYYARLGDDVVFASEAKALFEHPALDARLDKENFFHHLTFRSLPAPMTLFRGVEKLAAGEWAKVDLGTGRFGKTIYWNPLQKCRNNVRVSDARDELDALLDDSVAHRVEADVPVGVFLSGGLDSGLLLRLASRRRPDLHSFTIGYPREPRLDEAAPARALAARIGTCHHEVAVDDASFTQELCDVAWFQDEPIAAPVCVPVYLLARAARRASVSVAIGGEGSDELFIAYDSWRRLWALQEWNNRLPDLPGRLLRRIAASTVLGGATPFGRAADILRRAARMQPLFWGGAMDFAERGRLEILGPAMTGPWNDTYDAVIRPHWNRFREHRPASDIGGWMTYLDLRFRLPELMLPRLDKMGMAHAVEGRVPFLDHRIVEFTLSLPPALRSRSTFPGKRMLKAVAARHLPATVVHRRKRGFQAPVGRWKTGVFGRQYVSALSRFGERTGLFAKPGIDKLLSLSDDRLYFSLVNFMLWYLIFIENVLPESFPAIGQRHCRRPARIRSAGGPISSGLRA